MATPIGNLRDIGLRALDVLSGVDAVAAEDTRVTARLLERHGIAKPLITAREHNERRASRRVLDLLASGKAVALACDAGTPAISDPGALLVSAARAAGYAVTPVPGPNAAVAALSVAGFANPHFLFHGFLPSRAAERRGVLAGLARERATLVFHEAPHRVRECAADLAAVLGGGRGIVIARELTKLYESIHVCRLAEAEAWLAADPDRIRGEFVLVVEGAPPPGREAGGEARRTLEILLESLPVSRAVALAARLTGARRNDLYRLALEMKGRDQ